MKDDAELRAHLREPHDEARAHDNWSAIATRRRAASVPSSTPSYAWLGRLAIGGGTTLAIACALFLVWPTDPGPLHDADGSVAAGTLTPESLDHATLALDDGSRVSLDSGTRLEILENAGDHVRFWLHEGSASFDVVPGGPRRWSIESGLVTVEVLGTSFRVAHRAHEVEVSVSRGTVLVRGPTAPGGMQRLHAGDRIVVPFETPTTTTTTAELVAPDGIDASRANEDVPARPDRAPTRPLPTRTAPEAASVAEGSTPTPIATTETNENPTPPDRMRDADALRRAGRLDEAVILLGAIVDDPSADDRALAAFTLGRLELDRRQRPREAAAAFARAIELGVRAPLLEDARARRVEALSRFDHAAAEAAASDYDTHHPGGRWRDEVHAWSHAP